MRSRAALIIASILLALVACRNAPQQGTAPAQTPVASPPPTVTAPAPSSTGAATTAPRATGCGSASGGSGRTEVRTIASGGQVRHYRLHLPAGYQPATRTPLILAFHGRLKTASYMEKLTGFDALPAIVVYPDGEKGAGGQPAWNGAPYSPPVDDVLFVSSLLDHLQGELCVDESRIYLAGKSNGGGFASLLACRLAHRVAAVAAMSGAFYEQSSACPTPGAVPMLELHGTADGTAPYEGDPDKRLPTLAAWLERWRIRNGCAPVPGTAVDTPAPGVTRMTWRNCAADLVHYKIDGLGHDWAATTPNPDTKRPAAIDASSVIWEFFQAHTLPAAR